MNMDLLQQYREEFLAALSRDWSAMDFRTFQDTIDVLAIDPLIAEEWTYTHTQPMLEACMTKNMPAATCALLLHNPSSIRSMLYYDLLMAKCARAGLGLYERIFEFYTQALLAICDDDIFAYRFRNTLHETDEIAKLRRELAPAKPGIARALGRLANACYNLSHTLYSDMNPQLLYDNYGPYEYGGSLFVVKHFGNLRPLDLWPETESLTISDIKIGLTYEGVTFKVDSATHAMYEGDIIAGLRAWSCVGDRQRLSKDTIHALQNAIEELTISLYQRVKLKTHNEKKYLYVRQKAWGYKKLFDALGLDWHPEQSVFDAIARKHSFTAWKLSDDKEVMRVLLRGIFDPQSELSSQHFSV